MGLKFKDMEKRYENFKKLKSDQNGIEIIYVAGEKGILRSVKIRPKWD